MLSSTSEVSKLKTDHKIGFVVAEDESLLRENLIKKILACDSRLACWGTARDGEEALCLVKETLPDILFTDIRMPVLSGLELIEKVRRVIPALGIIIVSGYNDFEFAQQAIRFQVTEYLLKPVSSEKLAATVARLCHLIDTSRIQRDGEFGLGPDGRFDSLSAYADAMDAWLTNNLRRKADLGTMCQGLGLKPAYAIKIYKRYKGTTPMRHLTVLRITEAKRILVRNPELEVKQVATLVGYSDQLYFSRVFSQETGMSPTTWRARGKSDG